MGTKCQCWKIKTIWRWWVLSPWAVYLGWFRQHSSCYVYFATVLKKIDSGMKRGFCFVMWPTAPESHFFCFSRVPGCMQRLSNQLMQRISVLAPMRWCTCLCRHKALGPGEGASHSALGGPGSLVLIFSGVASESACRLGRSRWGRREHNGLAFTQVSGQRWPSHLKPLFSVRVHPFGREGQLEVSGMNWFYSVAEGLPCKVWW